MSEGKRARLTAGESGQSLVETALLVPLLLVILLGAFETARAAVTASVLQNAVLAGAHYGSISPTHAANRPAIEAIVRAETRVPQASATNPSIDATVGDDPPRDKVIRVRATFTLTGLVPYPGLPERFLITRTTEWRVRRGTE